MPLSRHQCPDLPLDAIQRLEPGIPPHQVEDVMDMVHRQRKRIGRLKATDLKGFNNLLNEVWELLSRHKAAKDLDIDYPALKRPRDSGAFDGAA